jgi:hypothetical protein
MRLSIFKIDFGTKKKLPSKGSIKLNNNQLFIFILMLITKWVFKTDFALYKIVNDNLINEIVMTLKQKFAWSPVTYERNLC